MSTEGFAVNTSAFQPEAVSAETESHAETEPEVITMFLKNVTMTVATEQPPDIFNKYDFVSFMQEFCPFTTNVDRVVTIIWYVIGFTGNILSAKIWLDRRMRVNNSSAIYLAALSISDLIFLLLHTLQESEYAWGRTTLNHPVLCEAYFMFCLAVQYLSPILVLAFTCERWIAVCHPFVKEKFCTTKRALRVVILLICACLALGSMQAILWTYNAETDKCMLRESELLWKVWTWITEMLVFLIVPLVILIFNMLVIREVRHVSENGQRMMLTSKSQTKSQNNTSAATTVMLLSVSFYVIVTVLPATIVYAIYEEFPMGNTNMTEEQIRNDPVWQRYFGYYTFRKFIEEICISHYACNIFLYILTGAQFRKSLRRLYHQVIPKQFIKEDSFATMNSNGTHKTSIRNVYTAVAVNGNNMTKV